MSDMAEPAWHLLPGQPVEFFGLSEPFDRKELKRAYNALLRRFKPDKYPEEFQRLRAAYEQLDARLRYGHSQNSVPSAGQDLPWSAGFEASAAAINSADPASANQDTKSDADPIRLTDPTKSLGGARSQDEPITAAALVTRLEGESPEALYNELRQRPRSPYDYYALAILSDATNPPEALMFLKWLLTGLKRYPDQPALLQLLATYLECGQLHDDALPKIVTTISRIVSTDRFYWLTEKLFDRLTQSLPWLRLEELLVHCQDNIRDHQNRGRVVFTCHLLRRALWLAPIELCQRWLAYLHEHHRYLGDSLEYEFELNCRLLTYMQMRSEFVNKGEVAIRIDAALRSFCLGPSSEGHEAIVAAQSFLASHSERVFKEFGLAPEENMETLIPWIWISNEVEERLETHQGTPQPSEVVAATVEMMKQIDRQFPTGQIEWYNLVYAGSSWLICGVLGLAIPVAGAIAATGLPIEWQNGFFIMSVMIAVGAVLTYWIYFKKRTVDVWLMAYLYRVVLGQYRRWWRSLIARFFAATHFPFRSVDGAILQAIERHKGELQMSKWLPHFYSRDVGLILYSTAVRFLR